MTRKKPQLLLSILWCLVAYIAFELACREILWRVPAWAIIVASLLISLEYFKERAR